MSNGTKPTSKNTIPPPKYISVPVPTQPKLELPQWTVVPVVIPDPFALQSGDAPTLPKTPLVSAYDRTLPTLTLDKITETFDMSLIAFLETALTLSGWNAIKSSILRKYWLEKESILSQRASMGHYTLSGHYQKVLLELSSKEADELHQAYVKYIESISDRISSALGKVIGAMLDLEELMIKNAGLEFKVELQKVLTTFEMSLARAEAQLAALKEYESQLEAYIQGVVSYTNVKMQKYDMDPIKADGEVYKLLNNSLESQDAADKARLEALKGQMKALEERAKLLNVQMSILGGELYKTEVETLLSVIKKDSVNIKVEESKSKINLINLDSYVDALREAREVIRAKAMAIDSQKKVLDTQLDSLRDEYNLLAEKIRLFEKKLDIKAKKSMSYVEKDEAITDRYVSRYKQDIADFIQREYVEYFSKRMTMTEEGHQATVSGEIESARVRGLTQAEEEKDNAKMKAKAAEGIGAWMRSAALQTRLTHVL